MIVQPRHCALSDSVYVCLSVCLGGYVFNTEAHPVDAASLYCCSGERSRDTAAVHSMMTSVDLLSTVDDIFTRGSHQLSHSPPGVASSSSCCCINWFTAK